VGPFRRSGTFGIVGVIVVMAIVAVIGLNADPRDADPKGTFVAIFGVVAVFLVLLFAFQLRDLSAAEGADAQAATTPPHEIENPAVLDEADLWAAMAVRPFDRDAIKARKQIWATARGSINTAMLVCLLIFLAVPPIYLFDTFVPLFVGGPLIAGIALWKSLRLLGGGFDEAYETAGRAMAPLGLDVVEHPDLTIEPKYVAPLRMGPALHGALVMAGERHGRPVSVRMPSTGGVRTPSTVRVGVHPTAFEFKARDGRLKAADGAPEAVRALLAGVPNSPRWNGVSGSGGGEWIEVARKSSKSGDWLLDLWLAERLADAVR
jgi:hypothetical protein